MAPDRVKVLIAGNIYAKLALVRRFLEDDGYEVVGEPRTKQDVIRAVQAGRPDAVVIDEEFIDGGPVGTIPRIRSAQPGAKIIVFTSGPPVEETAPQGADGYLEKGAPLSALTSMLGRLFADRTAPIITIATDAAPTAPVDVVAAAKAAAMSALSRPDATLEPAKVTPVDAPDDAPPREHRFGGFRVAALLTGIVLIVWSLISMTVSNDSGSHPPTVAAAPSPSTIIEQPQSDELQLAYDTLDGMIAALQGANYVLATVDAQQLMQQRETAQSAGFSIGALDDEITSRMDAMVGTLPSRVTTQLQDIMGSLFPQLSTQPAGGGSTVVLGNPVTNPAPGGTTSGGGSTGGGGSGGGGGSTGGNGGGGGGEVTLGPGDGRAWGLSHKPPFGGWHGQKPKHHGKPEHPGHP
jgi:DNA-binding NarL/FixJ family response regulator